MLVVNSVCALSSVRWICTYYIGLIKCPSLTNQDISLKLNVNYVLKCPNELGCV